MSPGTPHLPGHPRAYVSHFHSTPPHPATLGGKTDNAYRYGGHSQSREGSPAPGWSAGPGDRSSSCMTLSREALGPASPRRVESRQKSTKERTFLESKSPHTDEHGPEMSQNLDLPRIAERDTQEQRVCEKRSVGRRPESRDPQSGDLEGKHTAGI